MKLEAQLLTDQTSRRRKAHKILTVLTQQSNVDLGELICVDVGCAYGLISHYISERFCFTLGIECDANSLNIARPRSHSRLAFIQADACRLPISTDTVDVIVCAQVYEHVSNDELLFQEIWRVLKPGGLCFFSGPNRLFPFEFHWRLPLVHWLPQRWSERLAQYLLHQPVAKLHLRTYKSLKRALARFEITDYTAKMIRDRERYALGDSLPMLRWLRRLPMPVLRWLVRFAPNFNWTLTKPVRNN
jgi:SAM-dependent methyltransferase